jgi:hypothetical protein
LYAKAFNQFLKLLYDGILIHAKSFLNKLTANGEPSLQIEEYWIMRRVSMRIGGYDGMVPQKIFDKFVVKSYKSPFNK